MATLTGANLVEAIQTSTGVELNALLQATLAARLQVMIDNGTYSKLSASIAMQSFSSEIKDVVGADQSAFADNVEAVAAAVEAGTEIPVFEEGEPVTIDPATATYTVTAASSSVTEGNGVIFTVTANGNLSAETTVNYQIQGVEVAGGTATPVADLGVLNGTVTIPAGASSATFTITPTADQVTEGYEGFKVVLLDSSFATIASSSNVVISDPENAGQTFILTTGIDGAPTFTGGAGNDIYTAKVNNTASATDATWTALDALDGGSGNDTLNINDISTGANLAGIVTTLGTIANIETFNLQAVGSIDGSTANDTTSLDLSAITGLTTVNTTKSTTALLTAAATTDVNVSGATGAITLVGGKNVSVTDASDTDAIIVGDGAAAAGDPAGTVTVTDTNNAGVGNTIAVYGGTAVTVTTTAAATSGAITVGHATNGMASGAVVVTQNTTCPLITSEAETVFPR